MSNPLDFLEGEPSGSVEHVETPAPAGASEATAETPPAGGQEAPSQPVRGADGRFAAASTEAPAVAAPAATASTPAAEPGHVPITALLDEREKRQAYEKQLAEYQARDAAAAKAAATPLPPEQQLQVQRYADNLRFSRRFAEKEYGKEEVAKVHDWVVAKCDADPLFNQQMRSSEDPYEAAMQAYQREQVLAEVSPSELANYRAWKAAQSGGQAPAAVSPPSPPAAVPRSLATAPGNGASGRAQTPVGEGNAYAGLFSH